MSKLKTVDIKGKAYVEVNERLIEFRTNPKFKGYSLESEIIQLENGVCTIKAVIKDEASRVIATGYAQEKENSSFINKTSYIENCETSAWGRALGNLGIGIDTSVASADEVLNAMENQKPVEDEILLKGIKAQKDLNGLREYFENNYQHAKNKEAFVAAKEEMKKELSK